MPSSVLDRTASASPSSQRSDVLSFEMEETSVRDDVLNDSLLTSDASEISSDVSPLATPPRPRKPQHSPSWTQRYLYRESSQAGKSRVRLLTQMRQRSPLTTQPPYVALPVTPEGDAPSTTAVPWTLPDPPSLGATRYVRKATWLLLLLAAYACTRVAVWLGTPHDGNRDLDPYDLQDDITKLLLYGFVLEWFARVTDSDRFVWLFAPSRWWFAAVVLGTPPVYSLISDIPGLQHSFSDISHWGAAQWTVVVVGLGALLSLTGYHIALARARMGQAELACYILSRCAVFTYAAVAVKQCHILRRLFGCTTMLAVREEGYNLHLHHLYLGWAFGLFAEFNTPLSAATLAVTSGIFVQGIGAYSFASNLYNPNCFQLPFGSAHTMTCNLAVPSGNVSIEVCPTRPSVHVEAHCTTPVGR